MGSARGTRGAESGNAMVIALLVLMVLSAAGVAYVALTKSEKQISGNEMRGTQAFYAAEAGLTEGLHRMSETDTTNYIGEDGDPTPGWGRYIVMQAGASALDPDAHAQETDGLDNNGDGNADEPGERYPEVLTKQTGPNPLQYPYVRVDYKMSGGQLVRYGDADKDPSTPMAENFAYGAPVLRISARGAKGNSNKIIDAEAVRLPLVDVLGAVWAGGPMGFSGNAFIIDGHDHQAASPHDTIPGAKPLPGILSKGPTSDIHLGGYQADNVMGSDTGGTGSVAQSTITYDFNQLWGQLVTLANNTFSGDQTWGTATPTYGTFANPQVTLVKGNLAINGGWSGAGILMVDGTLAMGGGSTFTGIVVVTGDVHLTGGGPADDARIVGGIIFGSSLIGSSTQKGSGRVWYSSQAVNNALSLANYTLSRWHER